MLLRCCHRWIQCWSSKWCSWAWCWCDQCWSAWLMITGTDDTSCHRKWWSEPWCCCRFITNLIPKMLLVHPLIQPVGVHTMQNQILWWSEIDPKNDPKIGSNPPSNPPCCGWYTMQNQHLDDQKLIPKMVLIHPVVVDTMQNQHLDDQKLIPKMI